jgi:hypothetical protein
MSLEAFTDAYIEAALWADGTAENFSPEGDGVGGEQAYREDLAPETLAQMKKDCAEFWKANEADIMAEGACNYNGCDPESYAGHDFWLTSRGHGCGFWDGHWNEPYATRLTNAAHTFPGQDLYRGDDGKVYMA